MNENFLIRSKFVSQYKNIEKNRISAKIVELGKTIKKLKSCGWKFLNLKKSFKNLIGDNVLEFEKNYLV